MILFASMILRLSVLAVPTSPAALVPEHGFYLDLGNDDDLATVQESSIAFSDTVSLIIWVNPSALPLTGTVTFRADGSECCTIDETICRSGLSPEIGSWANPDLFETSAIAFAGTDTDPKWELTSVLRRGVVLTGGDRYLLGRFPVRILVDEDFECDRDYESMILWHRSTTSNIIRITPPPSPILEATWGSIKRRYSGR